MRTALLLSWLLVFSGWLFGLTGYGTSAPVANDTVNPTLSITSPNGGEAWYIGDTHDVTWTASDSNLIPNSVYLWYSLNGGTSYIPLATELTNTGSYAWAVPSTQSNNARVRIKLTDSFGNYTQIASAAPFSITYVPPATPQGINVDISSNRDAVLTWQPVTQTVYDTPITPDGYIVLYNETPFTDSQYYYFLTMTPALTYTHQYVASFRSQMYYRVIAYKNYREDSLRQIEQTALSRPILWKDALQTLVGGE